MSFPSMRCEVYARAGQVADPVEPEWELQEHLLGRSLFVGLNYPLLLDAPPIVGDHAGGPVPVFRPNCVFASHICCNQHPRPTEDWWRLQVNGGVAIGSSLFYGVLDWGQFYEAPMWFVPDLPEPHQLAAW